MHTTASWLGRIAASAGVLLGVATPAHATVSLDLTDVSSGTTLACDTAFAVSAVNCGVAAGFSIIGGGAGIGFSGTVGGFSVFTTTFASNLPGTPTAALLNGSTTLITRTAAGQGDLRIDLVGMGYTMPAGPWKTLRGSASMTSSDNIFGAGDLVFSEFVASADNAMPIPGTDPTRQCTMSISSNSSCSTSSILWADPMGGTFSMRDVQLIRLSSGHTVNTTISGTVAAVPAPMTLSLVGAALLGAALAARRRVPSS
jgi:hypothetical protein